MMKSGFIGLRIDPLRKRELMEFAKRKGMTLTAYIVYLLKCGLEREEEQKLQDVKHSGELKQEEPVKKRYGALIIEEILKRREQDRRKE
jgi:hypothetical protein